MNLKNTDKIQRAVICIRSSWQDSPTKTKQGTGFFIDREGRILTCHHNIFDREKLADKISISIETGYEIQEFEASCIYSSTDPSELDFAILEPKQPLSLDKIGYFSLSEYSTISSQFDEKEILVNGYPSRQVGAIQNSGTIKGFSSLVGKENQFLILDPDEIGAQGMSGAPVLHTASGRVIGMVVMLLADHFIQANSKEQVFRPIALPIDNIKDSLYIRDALQEQKLFDKVKSIFNDIYNEQPLKFSKKLYSKLPFLNFPHYDSLTNAGTEKAVNEILEILRNRNLLIQTALYLPSLFKDSYQDLLSLLPYSSVNFINREDEQRQVYENINGALKYVFFEAPAGYGKSSLLKRIAGQYIAERKVVSFIEIPENATAVEMANMVAVSLGWPELPRCATLKEAAIEFAIVLAIEVRDRKLKGVVFLLDNAHKVQSSDQITNLFRDFILPIEEKLSKEKDIQLIVRIAGRFVGNLWRVTLLQNCNLRMSVIPLSPFSFEYVMETVNRYFGSRITDTEKQSYSACLMQVTGGHPGSMVHIIKRYDTLGEQDDLCGIDKEFVISYLKDFEQNLPEGLRECFINLAVFRRYNLLIFRLMKKYNALCTNLDPSKLEEKLTKTYLIEGRSTRSHFLRDNIVRRLLCLQLLWKDRSGFVKQVEIARDIYLETFNEPNCQDPEVLLIELLYQELQLQSYNSDGSIDSRRQLFSNFLGESGIVKEYLRDFVQRFPPDSPRNFKAILEPSQKEFDWEFEFAINYHLRDEFFSDAPYKKFVSIADEIIGAGLGE